MPSEARVGEANGRVYDPLTAQFFSPDPFVQAPGNWLNYNRYAYAYGNPFKYTDPSGEWVHLVVGAVAGGLINWISNGCKFTLEGLSYLGSGALAGVITAAAPGSYVLINAGLSATNNFIQQGFDPNIGLKSIDFTQVAFQGIMGGVISYAGGEFGKSLGVDKWFKGIDSPLLKNWLTGVTSNTIVGGLLGGMGAIADNNSETKFLDGVWSGVKMGVISGTINGVAGAINYSHENKVNLFSGKSTLKTVNYNFTPDPYGDNVTLYRGTTGSENTEGPLFMTDNPEYAATYIKNGGQVVEVTIPKNTLFEMRMNGVLNISPNSQYHINGSSGIEYRFEYPVKNIIVNRFK